jgi:hypothetical protein
MLALVKDSVGVSGVRSVLAVDLPKWDKTYALR